MEIREEILQLVELGRMPNESLNDSEEIDVLIDKYDTLLDSVKLPISLEEGKVLVDLFPENAFYDLHWDLLKLVESLYRQANTEEYKKLINQCPSEEWRETLIARFENAEKNEKSK